MVKLVETSNIVSGVQQIEVSKLSHHYSYCDDLIKLEKNRWGVFTVLEFLLTFLGRYVYTSYHGRVCNTDSRSKNPADSFIFYVFHLSGTSLGIPKHVANHMIRYDFVLQAAICVLIIFLF